MYIQVIVHIISSDDDGVTNIGNNLIIYWSLLVVLIYLPYILVFTFSNMFLVQVLWIKIFVDSFLSVLTDTHTELVELVYPRIYW